MAVESARLRQRRSSQEELPHARGQGAAAERRYPASEGRGGGREELHTPKVRGSSREEQPHIQGAVAARVPEGLEELLHVQCQEGWR